MKQILFLLISSSFLWSAIGNVASVKGNAKIVRTTGTLKVKSGMAIEVKDKVVTRAKARLQALLKDDTVVTIGPDSVFVFDAYTYGNKSESRVEMHSARGFFRSVTGKIGKLAPQRFKVKTASTTIGIRGTDFSASVSDKKEIITCHKGEISVLVGKKTYVVKEGELLILTKKGAKKSSDDDAFSVIIGDNTLSADALMSQAASGELAKQNALNTLQESSDTLDNLDALRSDAIVEGTQRDGIPPLNDPTVEFPDR